MCRWIIKRPLCDYILLYTRGWPWANGGKQQQKLSVLIIWVCECDGGYNNNLEDTTTTASFANTIVSRAKCPIPLGPSSTLRYVLEYSTWLYLHRIWCKKKNAFHKIFCVLCCCWGYNDMICQTTSFLKVIRKCME